MSRKITDLMEQLETQLLEEIEEIDVDKVCAERIKGHTMEKIQESQFFKDIRRKRRGHFKLGRMKKTFVIAIILSALIGIVVGAVSISPTLQEFFSKQLNLVLPHAQEVQKSVSQNGVTMTVDTAIAGNSGGLIVLRVTKDDGSALEEGSEFKKFEVNIEGIGSSAYGHGWQLSEDKKILTYMIDLKKMGSIVDVPIKITGRDIVRVTQNEEIISINLDEVKSAREIELYTSDEITGLDGESEIKLPENGELKGISLEHSDSDMVLGSVGFKNGTLYLYMEYTEAEGSLWQLYKLVDIRTGETLYSDNTEGRAGSDNRITIEKSFYQGITPEVLPYIKLVNLYNTYEVFEEGEWKLSFTLAPNKNIKTFKGKKSVVLKGERYDVERIEISALGGSIEGKKFVEDTSIMRNGLPELNVRLYLEDGSSIMMNHIMASGGDDGGDYNVYIEAGEHWGSLTTQEKEKRRQEANENMYKRTEGYEYFLDLPIIDIDQVESIQIEDMIFPLK